MRNRHLRLATHTVARKARAKMMPVLLPLLIFYHDLINLHNNFLRSSFSSHPICVYCFLVVLNKTETCVAANRETSSN